MDSDSKENKTVAKEDRAAEKQLLRDQEQSELDWARLGHKEPIER